MWWWHWCCGVHFWFHYMWTNRFFSCLFTSFFLTTFFFGFVYYFCALIAFQIFDWSPWNLLPWSLKKFIMLQKKCNPLYQCVNMNNGPSQRLVALHTYFWIQCLLKCWSSLYSSKWNLNYQVCNEYDRLRILQIIILKAHFLGSGSSFVAKKNLP